MFDCDVLVAGGGNAALCSAIAASERGSSVIVLESASREFRAGNSRHTRNFRLSSENYPEDEFFADLLRVTGGATDTTLARLAIHESVGCRKWIEARGGRFQPALNGTLHLDRTNAFFLGGGKALMNSYYTAAEKRGVRVVYDAEVTGVRLRDGRLERAIAKIGGRESEIRAKAFVAAAGGFEANIAWLGEAWGDAAKNFIVRGTPWNRGTVLKALLDSGVTSIGDSSQCHAVAVDARSPKFDGGIVTRLDCIPLGIVVNRAGARFYDEGEDLWPKRYAIWGRLVAQQPGQIAYAIVDAKTDGLYMPSVFPALEAGTIADLAHAAELLPDRLQATVDEFNRSVAAGDFNHTALDTCRTSGLVPAKSHWARRIDTPPFRCYPLRPGITFAYLGVRVDEHARVILQDGAPAPNIFAAGEIMAGNILGQGYLAGIGMTIGTVFGRIAGSAAASV